MMFKEEQLNVIIICILFCIKNTKHNIKTKNPNSSSDFKLQNGW